MKTGGRRNFFGQRPPQKCPLSAEKVPPAEKMSSAEKVPPPLPPQKGLDFVIFGL